MKSDFEDISTEIRVKNSSAPIDYEEESMIDVIKFFLWELDLI